MTHDLHIPGRSAHTERSRRAFEQIIVGKDLEHEVEPVLDSAQPTRIEIHAVSGGALFLGQLPMMFMQLWGLGFLYIGVIFGVYARYRERSPFLQQYPTEIIGCGAVVCAVLFFLFSAHYVFARQTSCEIVLDDNDLGFRACLAWGRIRERWFKLSDIETIYCGEYPSGIFSSFIRGSATVTPGSAAAQFNSQLMRGSIIIREKSGRKSKFVFNDNVFGIDNLMPLVAEMHRRGVQISSSW